jgi:hypothetical protein
MRSTHLVGRRVMEWLSAWMEVWMEFARLT